MTTGKRFNTYETFIYKNGTYFAQMQLKSLVYFDIHNDLITAGRHWFTLTFTMI